MTVTIFMVSLCGAMFVGMPVAFALLVCAVSLMVYLISIGTLDTFNTQIMAQYLISGADNFPLMAIPFFMLAGEIMTKGGISHQIVKIANALVGHIRGGLGDLPILAGAGVAHHPPSPPPRPPRPPPPGQAPPRRPRPRPARPSRRWSWGWPPCRRR